MNDNVKMNIIWLVIVLVGAVLFIYGYYFHDFFFEGLGALSGTGSLFCIISDIFMKIHRKKRGKRFQ
ncbi:hypothetical protein VNN41_06175 [Lactococcus garvieae]|uniref:hypothetical protein n=1 Tax=Lactococcus garvieae TaxID=1363 RepID=UPI003252A5B6